MNKPTMEEAIIICHECARSKAPQDDVCDECAAAIEAIETAMSGGTVSSTPVICHYWRAEAIEAGMCEPCAYLPKCREATQRQL